MLVVLSLKCYADRIGTSAMERSAIVKIAFVTAIATLAVCLTAPTPPRSAHSSQNVGQVKNKDPLNNKKRIMNLYALVMVKNESAVIERTLDSVGKLIKGGCQIGGIYVYDTGSVDGTLDICKKMGV